jgi:serine/threonine-protein kinase RsbT
MIFLRLDIDVLAAREAARRMADALGMPPLMVHEMCIVASELAWNVIKHGGGGHICFEPVEDFERGTGLRIVAFDAGPPIYDMEMAMRDGCDDRGPIDPATLLRRGGIGGGLGAVARLTDVIRHEPLPKGKRIEAVRYLRRPSTRPRPGIRRAS